ncbi:hypothetical protein C791_7367 [Amycolatopsis azurea DSM 43854]|uniref:Uncharacterized protein n=1 Tax=Amycolatopsis azurea DSM 43854 TaxID=1238180 RepID=M2QAZ5_9PSEU|nr:hypothetical protein C791_7367 [Amycolatopsis azurea DSM 43854]
MNPPWPKAPLSRWQDVPIAPVTGKTRSRPADVDRGRGFTDRH